MMSQDDLERRSWWMGRKGGVIDTLIAQLRGQFNADDVLGEIKPKWSSRRVDATWVALLPLTAIQHGEVVEVHHHGHPLAVARQEGGIFVLDGVCPHTGGPLGQGKIVDGALICPFHQWPFDLQTGACRTVRSQAVTCYRVEVIDGDVCVAIDGSAHKVKPVEPHG